ncbi:MAG: hypothetical protein J0H78_12560 [Rhizobiales bacterium]|nr:hypothetical protein [Hyphomicrobiales bacterium]OJY44920.1 MAG: hypothetical protein BGP08_01155 [Rhizobiales bacterium 64-17]
MNLAIRQKLQNALEQARSVRGAIAIDKTDGGSVTIELDLICYETTVQATAEDGSWVEIPYSDIAAVHSVTH